MYDKLFFHPDLNQDNFDLTEGESKHISQVLRYKTGDQLNLTDGFGQLVKVEISSLGKKSVSVKVLERKEEKPTPNCLITLAVGMVKSTDRLEWMVEKLTEIGIGQIVFLDCDRNERKKINLEKLERKSVSAMKQSGQLFKPVLSHLKWEDFFRIDFDQKFIAHCERFLPEEHLCKLAKPDVKSVVCIGPEGDFSEEELKISLANGFIPVNLGATRLRTETAAIIAAHSLSLNYVL